jgi:FtsP/CotA-like multicopper oxidase with cupredoxin domain
MGGAGLAGVAIAGTIGCTDRSPEEDDQDNNLQAAVPGSDQQAAWPDPATLRSSNGILDATLHIAAAQVPHGDSTRWALTVNGTTPGPTLRVRPGDHLRLTLANRSGHATNLHTHGLHVSPSGNSDNPFIEIADGEDFLYDIHIPDSQPGGLFWYHPHLHHHVAEQVFAGFFGAIVVEDDADRLPELAGSHDRLVMLHDTRVGATAEAVMRATMMEMHDGREGDLITVNGAVAPHIPAEAGTLERWRVLNASASRFYRLALDGHSFHVIGADSGRHETAREKEELILVPGERLEVLVRPGKSGSYRLQALPVDRGSMGMGGMGGGMGGMGRGGSDGSANLPLDLATMVVTGDAPPPALPPTLLPYARPSVSAPARTRELTFDMRGPSFLINGRSFDIDRIDNHVKFGTTEDWIIRNVSTMDHPFHLHVWPFQVIEQSDGRDNPGWKDVVNVPAGGWVRLRIPFEGVNGKTVYHCHILDHEDMGMMGIVEVA